MRKILSFLTFLVFTAPWILLALVLTAIPAAGQVIEKANSWQEVAARCPSIRIIQVDAEGRELTEQGISSRASRTYQRRPVPVRRYHRGALYGRQGQAAIPVYTREAVESMMTSDIKGTLFDWFFDLGVDPKSSGVCTIGFQFVLIDEKVTNKVIDGYGVAQGVWGMGVAIAGGSATGQRVVQGVTQTATAVHKDEQRRKVESKVRYIVWGTDGRPLFRINGEATDKDAFDDREYRDIYIFGVGDSSERFPNPHLLVKIMNKKARVEPK